jgi:hypothetical protein
MGLPLQSVMYHQPLRLSVAAGTVARVSDILNEHLKNLLDNEWIYLMVMDPLDDKYININKVSIGILLVKSNTYNVVEMMPSSVIKQESCFVSYRNSFLFNIYFDLYPLKKLFFLKRMARLTCLS